MAMLAVSMFHKLSCDKFMGERFCVRAGTLSDAAWPIIGVIALGSNGVLFAVIAVIGLCDLVWYLYSMREVKIGYANASGCLFYAALSLKLIFWNWLPAVPVLWLCHLW
jgi:hypothetical protein